MTAMEIKKCCMRLQTIKNAFAMGHTTSEGVVRANGSNVGFNECEILFEGVWFPFNMRIAEWLPLSI